jgi:hypothetical protein
MKHNASSTEHEYTHTWEVEEATLARKYKAFYAALETRAASEAFCDPPFDLTSSYEGGGMYISVAAAFPPCVELDSLRWRSETIYISKLPVMAW